MKLKGKYSSINNITLVDNSGAFVSQVTVLKQQHELEDLEENEEAVSQSIDLQVEDAPKDSMYVKVEGTDAEGEFSLERNGLSLKLFCRQLIFETYIFRERFLQLQATGDYSRSKPRVRAISGSKSASKNLLRSNQQQGPALLCAL